MGFEYYIFSTIYFIIFMISLCGNSITLIAITRNKNLHVAVYIFLANQSISDILLTIMSLGDYIMFIMKNWVFGDVVCKICGFLGEIPYAVSILSLTAMAVERYLAICHLQRGARSIMMCIKWCIAIWFVSAVFASPVCYLSEVFAIPHISANITSLEITYTCTSNGNDAIFRCIQFALLFILPLCVMIFAHSKILITLKRGSRPVCCRDKRVDIKSENTTHSVGENDTNEFSNEVRNIEATKARKDQLRNRKIIKMLVVVTSVFAGLWGPSFINLLVRITTPIPKIIWWASGALAFISTTNNFFIFLKMSPEFKNSCASIFRFKRITSNVQPKVR